MMVSSFEYPSVVMPSREETTKPIYMMYLLSTFALCLGIGCLLMLPLAPHYRLVGTHYCAALLPLLFTWWGIIIPVVTYWLFQQYVSTYWGEATTPQIYDTAPEPGTGTLNFLALHLARQWSFANHQKYDERILHMMRQEEALEAMAIATGMDKKRMALPMLSSNSGTVRTALLQWFGEKQHKRAPPQISLRQPISSIL
ncbi:hypothetical protein [Dictyobacter aurantiacus]|uniref:hypothetical protein n=1 Tax=Dictyobacter aurantiacus TaxID=1936993 RepID=UPI000F822A05|nr:hypothetical protein [Dictyobacter aurantiacus]